MSSAKTVFVTGAAGNLGRAIAAAFEQRGANLVLVARTKESLAAALGTESERRVFIAADLLDQGAIDWAVRLTRERFGRLDILCNIAGGFKMGPPVHETSDKDWDFLMDINARTMLHAVRAAVPQMIDAGGGKIVNVGAFAAQKGVAQMGATYLSTYSCIAAIRSSRSTPRGIVALLKQAILGISP